MPWQIKLRTAWHNHLCGHACLLSIIIIIIIRIYLNRPELILSRGCGLAAQSWSQTSSPCLAVFGVSSYVLHEQITDTSICLLLNELVPVPSYPTILVR